MQEEKPHLGDEYCLSDVVAVPQGRVFEELFSSDYQNKFWYKELADMVYSINLSRYIVV